MPWPPPVTMAVLPFSLNFSRYMALSSFGPHRRFDARALIAALLVESDALVVEAMHPDRVRRQPHLVAGRKPDFADTSHGEHAPRAGVDIKKRVAAEVLGHRNGSRPALPFALDPQMLGPHADGRGAQLARGVTGDEVHFRGTDEAGDEQV